MQPLTDGVGWEGFGAAALQRLFDRLRVGVVVIDGVGQILGCNGAARALLGSANGTGPPAGTTEFMLPELARRLAESVCAPDCSPRGHGLAVPRDGQRRPLEFVGVPLGPLPGGNGRQPAALLVLHDPDVPMGCAPGLRDLYRLTPAEERVAVLLVDGHTVEQVAAALGLSRHTVRTHVKHLLAKIGVRSQTDLVRRVLGGPLGLLASLSAS